MRSGTVAANNRTTNQPSYSSSNKSNNLQSTTPLAAAGDMIKATKMLKKPSTDLYKPKLKSKSNEKQISSDQQQNDEVTLVCAGSGSMIASGSATIIDQQQPLKKFSLKGNQLSGSILIGNYNVRQKKTVMDL